jgi:hypothetical protein
MEVAMGILTRRSPLRGVGGVGRPFFCAAVPDSCYPAWLVPLRLAAGGRRGRLGSAAAPDCFAMLCLAPPN